MDKTELLERVQSARSSTGRVTPASLRQQSHDDLEAELRGEQATTLSRLGRRLDAALATLWELEAEAAGATPTPQPLVFRHEQVRRELLEARWEMKVVREAMGLRGVHHDIDETWPVPPPLR